MNRKQFGRLMMWIAVAALVMPVGTLMAESILIAPRFETGQVWYTETTEDATQRFRGGMAGPEGMEMRSMEIRGVLEKVESATAGEGTKLSLTFDRVSNSMSGAMMSMSFDSDVDDLGDRSNAAGIVFAPMIGMSLMLELDGEGKAISASGSDAILKKMEESATGSAMLEQQKPQMTDEAAKANWGDGRLVLYPNKKVSEGDTWKGTVRSPSPIGPMIQEFDCKFERMATEGGAKVAVVSYKGTIRRESDEPVPAGPMGPIEMKSAEFAGTALFDPRVGRFVKQEGTAKIALGMATPEAETPEDGATESSGEGKVTGEGEVEETTPAAPSFSIEIEIASSTATMTTEERKRQREENRTKGEELRRKAEAEEEAEFADEDS